MGPVHRNLLPQEIASGPDSLHTGESLHAGDSGRVALGVALVAIAMFAITGGAIILDAVNALKGLGEAPNRLLINALLLNIALILLGWRLYRNMQSTVASHRHSEALARHQANTDPLTGCLNRRSLDQCVDSLIKQAALSGNVVAYLLLDLDGFKRINDFNGHSVGDAILAECSKRIKLQLPSQAVIARIGGDEFVCAIPFFADKPQAIDQLASRILEATASPINTPHSAVSTTISVGIAHSGMIRADGKAVDAQLLLQMADLAMYRAKKSGRNCALWFEDGMISAHYHRIKLEAAMREAIENSEFVPYYQPLIALKSKKLVGFEMLARWSSEEHGAIMPDIFIPLAEETALIAALSESLLDQALHDAREWDPSLMLSVNISPLQLQDDWFAQKLLKKLIEANFPPQRLDIEITESCLHGDLPTVRNQLFSLKNQGVKISLDDFGTGYSSLVQLQSLPFDHLKIDRSLVTDIAQKPNDAAVLRMVTTLGHDLGLTMTAEGIETQDVVDQLSQFGEFIGQGYLFGRPQNAEVTRQMLREQGLLIETNPAPVGNQTVAAPSAVKAERAA